MSLEKRIRSAWAFDGAITILLISLICYPLDRATLVLGIADYARGVICVAVALCIFVLGIPFSPLLFKNVSIGMRSMGLAIVNKDGCRPPLKIILMRQLLFYSQAKDFLWKSNRPFNTIHQLSDGFKYFGTKITCINVDDSETKDSDKHKLENQLDASNMQYLKPVSQKKDYNSYTVPVIKAVVAASIYLGAFVCYMFVFPALNVYEIYPWVNSWLLVISGLTFYISSIFLMSSIGYILYVSEKKKCLNATAESADGELSAGA